MSENEWKIESPVPVVVRKIETAYDRFFAAGRIAGLREAAEIVKPIGKRPCDCEPWRCYCDKTEDAASVAAWDHAEGLRVAILALAEEGEG